MEEPEHLARYRAWREAGDELTGFVLDDVVPVVNRLRLFTAARLGLTVHELACLDLLRQRGPLTTETLADRTGLTRSGLSRMLRRLEREGHVARGPDDTHAQRIVVTLVPHQERDDAAAELRFVVRSAMAAAASEAGLHRRRELAGAAVIMRILSGCLFDAARQASDRLTGRRRYAQRMRGSPRVID
ncbi:MarR family winged helix-turn-helix transcriptional regulator [Actinomycetospora sp. CA-084318]|uniref:MarR family winged helix-turn-helix transcriptional regulator n=1 Tax=Actinomycetospora sp. CA-084318 TaxID=3239892 RepID=UPI003D950F94